MNVQNAPLACVTASPVHRTAEYEESPDAPDAALSGQNTASSLTDDARLADAAAALRYAAGVLRAVQVPRMRRLMDLDAALAEQAAANVEREYMGRAA